MLVQHLENLHVQQRHLPELQAALLALGFTFSLVVMWELKCSPLSSAWPGNSDESCRLPHPHQLIHCESY